jgi:hypothetical protein
VASADGQAEVKAAEAAKAKEPEAPAENFPYPKEYAAPPANKEEPKKEVRALRCRPLSARDPRARARSSGAQNFPYPKEYAAPDPNKADKDEKDEEGEEDLEAELGKLEAEDDAEDAEDAEHKDAPDLHEGDARESHEAKKSNIPPELESTTTPGAHAREPPARQATLRCR